MIDYRMKTFICLCEELNYRATAEKMNLTQPAVTQQIQYLEKIYGCKLFEYKNRRLVKTVAGEKLEELTRSEIYSEKVFYDELENHNVRSIKIGATKSIGGYVINDSIKKLAVRDDINFHLYVDNTRNLLSMLDRAMLNFVVIEGLFDKQKYSYRLMKKEPFVGICAKGHPLEGKHTTFEDIINEKIIMREDGSGTRDVFEHILIDHNHSLKMLPRKTYINSIPIIKNLVRQNCGISFVYKAVADSSDDLGVFYIEDDRLTREFNFVFLKDTNAEELIDEFF